MIPSPQHLRACTVPSPAKAGQHQYAGDVRCRCGCDTFEMWHAGATHEVRGTIIPCTAQIDGAFFFRIVAKCTDCGAEHLLFDKDFHGWDGFVCRDELRGHLHPRPPLVAWQCDACGEATHKADVVVVDEDKEDAIEESGGLLNDANWQEGFGWICIDLCCAACGHRHQPWVSYETM